jgi:hypothetical protein
MKVIRYLVKPEHVAENEGLIQDVFRELDAKRPGGTRYLVLALPDGTFIHVAEGEITTLDSHREFRTDINARCLETPKTVDAKIVGEYRSNP